MSARSVCSGSCPCRYHSDRDYGFAEANTTYGQIGIKVWLYKGERLVPQRGREEEYRERAPRRPQARP